MTVVITTLDELRAWRKALVGRLAFVPTMGYLHQGHEALFVHAKSQADHVIMSVFVNPTQFNDANDYQHYPRDDEHDLAIAQKHKVTAVWKPATSLMYQKDDTWAVVHPNFNLGQEGLYRPGHFKGVATVVMKLIHQVQPDYLLLGEKDYQQYEWIKRMVQHFFLPVTVIRVDTVRERSGLAMSSRNARLSQANREKASLIYKVLSEEPCMDEGRQKLEDAGFKIDYFEQIDKRRFIAAWLDGIRLIDTLEVEDKA